MHKYIHTYIHTHLHIRGVNWSIDLGLSLHYHPRSDYSEMIMLTLTNSILSLLQYLHSRWCNLYILNTHSIFTQSLHNTYMTRVYFLDILFGHIYRVERLDKNHCQQVLSKRIRDLAQMVYHA